MQRVGGREPMRGELGRFYDAIENPRKTRNELPILRGDELRAYMAEVRERTLEVLDGVELEDADDPLLARRLRLRDAARPRAPAQRDDAAAAADGRRLRAGRASTARSPREPVARGPGDGRGRRPARTRSAPGRDGFAYDNERPRHAVELAAFEIDRDPGHQRRLRRVRRRDRRRAAALLGARRRGGWVTTDLRPPRRRSTRRSPVIHVDLAPGRRLRPLGRQAAADRARVGGGGAGADREPRQPRPARLRLRRRPGPTATPPRLRRRADARRRLGVDLLGLRRLPRLRARSPIPSTRRSSSATPTRCCAAAPGRPGAT